MPQSEQQAEKRFIHSAFRIVENGVVFHSANQESTEPEGFTRVFLSTSFIIMSMGKRAKNKSGPHKYLDSS